MGVVCYNISHQAGDVLFFSFFPLTRGVIAYARSNLGWFGLIKPNKKWNYRAFLPSLAYFIRQDWSLIAICQKLWMTWYYSYWKKK